MDFTKLRQELSKLLTAFGVDDLQLEVDIVALVKRKLEKEEPVSALRDGVIKALLDGGKLEDTRLKIVSAIEQKLHMNPNDRDGLQFIEYAFLRAKHGEDINTFVSWWKINNPNPTYWSFKRMKELWPMAFATPKQREVLEREDKWSGDFTPPPERKE